MTTATVTPAGRPPAAIRPGSSETTDEELLARIADRDESALAVFYTRYRPLAFSLALRVVGDGARAEDVLQDAFLAVWRKAGTYAPGRGSARTWLSSIVRNRAIDVVRATRERAVQDDEELLLGIRDPAPAVFDQVAAALDGEITRHALRQLPGEQRQAITLAYFDGLSHTRDRVPDRAAAGHRQEPGSAGHSAHARVDGDGRGLSSPRHCDLTVPGGASHHGVV